MRTTWASQVQKRRLALKCRDLATAGHGRLARSPGGLAGGMRIRRALPSLIPYAGTTSTASPGLPRFLPCTTLHVGSS